MEQAGEAPAVCRAEFHREYVSTCAFLSYIIYEKDIAEDQWEGQPTLQARKSDPGKNVLLVTPDDFDLVHWGIFSTDSILYLCFRGSVTREDWNCNFSVSPSIVSDGSRYVFHSGFWNGVQNGYKTIMRHIEIYLGERKLIVTGHSLGGALAQIFAFLYERECSKNNINSVLECVITFAAPQACIRTPPEHSILRDKCINYACRADPVPMLPGLIRNPNAAQAVQNMAWESSAVYGVAASIFKSRFTTILADVAQQQYLQMYCAFAHTAIVTNVVADDILFLTPDAHSTLVSHTKGNFTIASHSMLFYLGELYTLNLLSSVVTRWFVNLNGAIQAGNHLLIPEYYGFNQIMQRVQRTWADLLGMVIRPANVLRALIPLPVVPRRLVRYTDIFFRGSEYYFIDARINEDELTLLLKLCYNQIGEDNVQLYRPEDYSWMHDIKDINLFLRSVRPLSWAERQFGDIHEREQYIRELDDDDSRTTVQALSEDVNASSPLRKFAKEILTRHAKISKALNFEDVHSELHTEHRSICAYICYIMSVRHDVIKLENAPRLVADNLHNDTNPIQEEHEDWKVGLVHWKLYEYGDYLYLCFPLPFSEADKKILFVVAPLQVDLRDGEYILHSGFWATGKSAYNRIMKEIAKVRRPNTKLVVTGHSLGGCFAQMFALDLFNSTEKTFLEGVITFGASQTCIRTPPNHFHFEQMCINYCCEYDTAQFLPGLRQTEDNLDGVMLLDTKKLGIILKQYCPLGNTVILLANDKNNVIQQVTRYDHRKKTQQRALNAPFLNFHGNAYHSMLCYLGEMHTLRLLSDAVKKWFINLNNQYQSGESAAIKYYSPEERKLLLVKRSWSRSINLIMRPAIVLLGRFSDNWSYLMLGHSSIFKGHEGKEIAFLDPTASNIDIMAILANTPETTAIYPPEDYSWLEQVPDIVHFVKSYNSSDDNIPEFFVDMEKDPKLLMAGNEGVHALLRAMMKTLLRAKEPEITEKTLIQLLTKLNESSGEPGFNKVVPSQVEIEDKTPPIYGRRSNFYSRGHRYKALLEESEGTDTPLRHEDTFTAVCRMENKFDELQRQLEERFRMMENQMNIFVEKMTNKHV